MDVLTLSANNRPQERGDRNRLFADSAQRLRHRDSCCNVVGAMSPFATDRETSMPNFRTILLTLSLGLLTACGNLQVLKVAAPPAAAQGRTMELAQQPAGTISVAPNAIAIGDGTFVSQTKGGSAVAGVLFGPIGALANAANIAAETERVRKSVDPASVASIHPAVELASAWKEAGLSQRPDAPSAKVESFVFFTSITSARTCTWFPACG